MANGVAVGFGDDGGYLEMNDKPLIIFNLTPSITILLTDAQTSGNI
jgi:hypothetical protein